MKCLVVWVGLLMCLSAGADTFVPSLIYQVKPQYPIELQRMGMSGVVRAHFMVSAQGSVVDPNIRYSAHPAFSSATLDVIREWRFSSWPLEGDNPKQVDAVEETASTFVKRILSPVFLEAVAIRSLFV